MSRQSEAYEECLQSVVDEIDLALSMEFPSDEAAVGYLRTRIQILGRTAESTLARYRKEKK